MLKKNIHNTFFFFFLIITLLSPYTAYSIFDLFGLFFQPEQYFSFTTIQTEQCFQPVSAKIQQVERSHKGKSMSWANLEHLQQSDFSNLQLEKIVILKIL